MTLFFRCMLALAVLVPASLLASALPAAAASTIVLQYTGSPAGNTTATDMSGFGNDGTQQYDRRGAPGVRDAGPEREPRLRVGRGQHYR